MARRLVESWRSVADQQAGVLARRQLLAVGHTPHYVDRQVAASETVEAPAGPGGGARNVRNHRATAASSSDIAASNISLL